MKTRPVFLQCDPNIHTACRRCTSNSGDGAKQQQPSRQQSQHPHTTLSNSHVAAHDTVVAGIPPDATNAEPAVPVTSYSNLTELRQSIDAQQAFVILLHKQPASLLVESPKAHARAGIKALRGMERQLVPTRKRWSLLRNLHEGNRCTKGSRSRSRRRPRKTHKGKKRGRVAKCQSNGAHAYPRLSTACRLRTRWVRFIFRAQDGNARRSRRAIRYRLRGWRRASSTPYCDTTEGPSGNTCIAAYAPTHTSGKVLRTRTDPSRPVLRDSAGRYGGPAGGYLFTATNVAAPLSPHGDFQGPYADGTSGGVVQANT